MSAPRIAWNGNNRDFPAPAPSDWYCRRDGERNQSFSAGNVAATVLKALFWSGRILVEKFSDNDFEANLTAWWAWAVQGKQYAIARDSALTFDSTIVTVQTGVGGTTALVASTTGLTIGDFIILQHLTQPDYQKVRITNLTATTITFASTPSKYVFPIGSIVRHADYLPKVVSLDSEYPVREEILAWTFDHRFREDAA